MVGTANVLTFVLLPLQAMAVPMDSVVRRERQSVQVSPHGDIVRGGLQMEESLFGDVEKSTSQQTRELSHLEVCNIDFVRGPADSSNCTDAAQHTLILSESLCKQAADYSHAMEGTDVENTSSFYLPVTKQYLKPRGCFKEACEASPNKVCYLFNGVGDWPTSPEGEPICSRIRNLNGTKDSSWGCPAGYSVIDDHDTCLDVANCLSKTVGDPSIIGTYNATRQLDYPRGCFISEEDDKVYYNPKSALGEGIDVKGTPLCNVTNVVRWGPGGSLLKVSY